MEPDEAFLRMLLAELTDTPQDIRLERTLDERGVLLSLTINKNDMGKVIGREGAVAQSIRTLLRSVGMKHGMKVNLKILEPRGFDSSMQDAMAMIRD